MPKPPIEPGRPGDLMGILRHSLEVLEQLRDLSAAPEEAVPVALATKVALDYWITGKWPTPSYDA